MKKSFILIILGALSIWIYFTFFDNASLENYKLEVNKIIEERKKFLEYSEMSPFQQGKISYVEPQYFDIDPDYKVVANVTKFTEREYYSVLSNDEKEIQYIKYATLQFKLSDKELELLVLKPIGFGSIENYFCAFTDLSNGKSTYEGGRYLELKIGKSNKTIIDFNLAYNPYCAYSTDFSCPLPPVENDLNIEINAGEKYNNP